MCCETRPPLLHQRGESVLTCQMDSKHFLIMTCKYHLKCACRFVQQVADANATTQRLMDRLSESTHAVDGQDTQVGNP